MIQTTSFVSFKLISWISKTSLLQDFLLLHKDSSLCMKISFPYLLAVIWIHVVPFQLIEDMQKNIEQQLTQ